MNRLALYSWVQDPDFRPSCRLQTSDQVRSLRDNTIVQSAFKAIYTVQPNIAIPLYNPNAHVIVQPIWLPTTVQSAIEALDTAQPDTAMYCITPMVASIVQPIGPYTVPTKCSLLLYKVPQSRHCTAIMASHYIQPAIVALAPYNLVQSALNVSPLYDKVWLSIAQRWGNPIVNMYWQHLALRPGLT